MRLPHPFTSNSTTITLCLAGMMTVAAPNAEAQETDDQTLIYSGDGLEIRWHLQAGLNAVTERNLFWNISDTLTPESGFNPDSDWLESYLKGGLSFEQSLENGSLLYGRLTGVSSYTVGTDAFDAGDTGSTTLEEGYLGFSTSDSDHPGLDISIGPRGLVLGSGMLIANGGANGFERGALKFGPRKAWQQAAIMRVAGEGIQATQFYIDPNELPASDGKNKLAGMDVRYDSVEGGYLGLTYINVLESNSPYPKAPPGGVGAPTVIRGGRDGTNALNLYARTDPFEGLLRNWFFTTDLAYEWNDRIDMSAWAGRVQVGYAFTDIAWSPTLTYSFQTFSGDNPNTARLERFDPLYYEGSPGAWATGSKSSMVFINSNLRALELAFAVQPSKQDALTLRFARIDADKLGSPIQFGQTTRLVSTPSGFNLISGVTKRHLSDDLFLEYNHIFGPDVFLTAGVSASFPGAGIKAAFPGTPPIWSGAFINVVVNY